MQAFCEGFKLLLVLTKKLTGEKKNTEKRESGGQRETPTLQVQLTRHLY